MDLLVCCSIASGPVDMGGDAEAASAAAATADTDLRGAALEPIQEASPTQEAQGADDGTDIGGADVQMEVAQPAAAAQLPDTEPAHSADKVHVESMVLVNLPRSRF